MPSYRTLNLIDLFKFKLDFLWGKSYYAYLEKKDLIDYILYNQYFKSKHAINILELKNNSPELLKAFLNKMSKKSKVQYFYNESDEKINLESIELLKSQGFQRINRNYCFEYKEAQAIETSSSIDLLCRDAHPNDIHKLMDIDSSAQIIEYRDFLVKSKSFFKEQLNEISVFVNPKDTSKIYAFSFPKENYPSHTFEFVLHPNLSSIIPDCIESFAEHYIKYHKHHHAFRFIINENHGKIVDSLQKHYELNSVSQLLLRDSFAKAKKPMLKAVLFPRRATAG